MLQLQHVFHVGRVQGTQSLTQTRRSRFALVSDWFTRHPFLLPLAIVVGGGAFRFYNLNWDDGQLLHPDERGIFMLLLGSNNANHPMTWPASLGQFFDATLGTGSPLDPHYFAYGSLPYYLLAFAVGLITFLGQHVPLLSPWSQLDTYGGMTMLARGLSAALDLLSLALVFFIARRIYGYWTAVLAMALSACTVLDIQLSHFYQVDTVLLPLVLLTLLAAIVIVQTNARSAYLWGGVALGAALASKTTALLLIVPLGAAALLSVWADVYSPETGSVRERLLAQYSSVARRLNRNLQWLLLSYIMAAVTFALCEPYAILDRQQLVKNIAEQTRLLVTNDPPFGAPYTIQYAHTLPYLYQLKNLLFWSMGIPLAAAAFAGVLFALVRNVGIRVRAEESVLLLWILPYFLFVGRFFAKFDRYMLPITPLMTILGAAFLVWLILRARGRWRALAWLGLAVVTVASFLYSLAYMNIYDHSNTRVAASRWIYAHVPPGATIATEGAWDDALPLTVGAHSAAIYHQVGLDPNNPGLNLYNPDDANKIANFTSVLTHARYIIMSSERMIGSIPRLPDRYPFTTRYYDLLLGGKLNFRLVRTFEAHPQLGPIVVQDYGADESFHVYDHPIVRIFKRVSTISPSRVAALLTGAAVPSAAASPTPARRPQPDTRLTLNTQQWRADQSGPTMDQMFPPSGFAMKHPILVWLLAIELLGLIAFPFTFLVMVNLLDRGFVIAKTLGLLVLGYAVWIIVRLGAASYDQTLIAALLCGFALLSAALAYRLKSQLAAFLRLEWRTLLAGEVVFLAGFALFILLRMWYPDLGHQFTPVSPSNIGDGRMGEKQMEMAFLNAIVRSRVFPPYDPFFAHGYINYYYYGFVLVGTLCKLTEIAPATGFNFAIATFFAMLVGNVFSVVLSLTRRITPGVLGAMFVGVFGNLNGAWQLARSLMAVATIHSAVPIIGGIRDIASGLMQAVFNHQAPPPFDYWESTRIVPPVGGPITEFPYFTYLFADLHPHLMAHPMTVAALALAVSLALGSYPRRLHIALALVLGGLLLGAIAVTNPWDYPTYLLMIGVGALVGAYVIRRRLGRVELLRPALWVGGLALVSFLLYLPFKSDYQTVFTTGIGLTRDITPDVLGGATGSSQVREALVTPLHIYLEHFGLFIFAIASFLVLVLLLDAGLAERAHRWKTAAGFAFYYRERPHKIWHATRVAGRMTVTRQPVVDISILIGFGILVAGLLLLQYFLLALLGAMLGLLVLLLLRLGKQMAPTHLFLFALIATPILLSAGTQVFFIKDWLAGGSDFRMNTIFKFYNQAWVLYAVATAVGLYYFMASQFPAAAPHPNPMDRDESTFDPAGETESRRGQLDVDASIQTGAHAADIRPAAGSDRGPALVLAAASRHPLELARFTRLDADHTDTPGHASVATKSQSAERPALPRPPGDRAAGRLRPLQRPMALIDRHPLWSLCLALLVAASLIYTYAGTVSRETYRQAWLPENSVPFTLDGMAFMKVTYPQDYAGIQWLNAHVHGAQVIAEADDTYYDWRSRVSMFTGLPTIINGIHEAEQRYSDPLEGRRQDVKTLYSTSDPAEARRILRRYDVRYVFVGFSERQCAMNGDKVQCYPRVGLVKFDRMVGHGLKVAFHQPGITIYQVEKA